MSMAEAGGAGRTAGRGASCPRPAPHERALSRAPGSEMALRPSRTATHRGQL